VLVFAHVFDFPGVDPSLPQFAFVFLVAIGADYSIFLTARVREELRAHGTRAGVVCTLLVPALIADLGDRTWWPIPLT
jgi:RND superfamily putative drug exporter